MIRHFSFFSLLLLLSLPLTGQKAASLDDFFEKLTKGEAAYVHFDASWEDYISREVHPKSWYYEILELDEQWYFYQHSYVSETGTGFQRFCACELEDLQKHLEDQIKADSSGTNSTRYFYRLPFSDEKCMSSYAAAPLAYAPPVLKQFLQGELLPPQQQLDTLDAELEANMLRGDDGRWILDIELAVADSLEILKMVDQQLFYWQSSEQLFYPAPEVPVWKGDLVRNGFYSNQIVQAPSATEDWEYVEYRSLDTDDPTKRLNVQMLVPINERELNDEVEAVGLIKLFVTDGSLESKHQKMGTIEAGKQYALRLNEEGTVYVEEQSDSASGGLWFHHRSYWRKLVFYEAGGDTLARFERGEAARTQALLAKEGKTYMAKVTGPLGRQVMVPFQVSLAVDHLRKDTTPDLRILPPSVSFSAWGKGWDNHKIDATYMFHFFAEQQVDTFMLTGVYDDTGRNLLANQADSLNALRRWMSSIGEKPDDELEAMWASGYTWQKSPFDMGYYQAYLLNVRLWDQMAPTASSLYVEGELYFSDADGTDQQMTWRDTFQLGSSLPFEPHPQPRAKITSTTALGASGFSLNPYGTYHQGLEANFELALPPDQVFVRADMEHSYLSKLHDNLGYDLLLLEEQMKEWNQVRNKRRINPYEYSYTNLLADGNVYFKASGLVVPFRIQCQILPTPGATQVLGNATIAYSTFSPDMLLGEEHYITYEEQEVIELMVNGALLRYKRAPFTTDVNGQTFNYYRLQTSDLEVFVAITALLEDEKLISPGPDEIRDIHHLYIPEDYEGELHIGVLYGELQHHQTTVAIEVSTGGTMN